MDGLFALASLEKPLGGNVQCPDRRPFVIVNRQRAHVVFASARAVPSALRISTIPPVGSTIYS